MNHQLLPSYVFSLLFFSGLAHAGAPLSQDDPGILDPGGWEFNAAWTSTAADSGTTYQQPFMDVNFGISQSIQIAAGIPYVKTDPDDAGSESDWGNSSIGAKWRFLDGEKLQLAFNPRYSFGVSDRVAAKGIADSGDVLGLPITMEYALSDRLRINTEVAKELVDDGDNGWFYAGALSYSATTRLDLMAEFSGIADDDFNDDLLDIRLGFDLAISESLHLLFSVATGLRESDDGEEMDYDIYLGLQLFL